MQQYCIKITSYQSTISTLTLFLFHNSTFYINCIPYCASFLVQFFDYFKLIKKLTIGLWLKISNTFNAYVYMCAYI